MNTLTEDTILIPITSSSHSLSLEFSRAYVDDETRDNSYLALLTVCAVKDYLQYVGIETDIDSSECWNTQLKACETADLFLPEVGTLECRPLLDSSESFSVVSGTELGRICFVAVKLDDDLREASIVGFYPIYSYDKVPETISVSDLKPVDVFLDFLEVIKSFRSALCENVIAEIYNTCFDHLLVYLQFLFSNKMSDEECLKALVEMLTAEQSAKEVVIEYYDILDLDRDSITDQLAAKTLQQICSNALEMAKEVWIGLQAKQDTIQAQIRYYSALSNQAQGVSPITQAIEVTSTKLSNLFLKTKKGVLEAIDFTYELIDEFMNGKVLVAQPAFRDQEAKINPVLDKKQMSEQDFTRLDADDLHNKLRWEIGEAYSKTLALRSIVINLSPLPVSLILFPIDREDSQVTVFLKISIDQKYPEPKDISVELLDEEKRIFETVGESLSYQYIFTVRKDEVFGFRVKCNSEVKELFFQP